MKKNSIDDGDIIRGLGLVALYTAYLEEMIDGCVAGLRIIDTASSTSLEKMSAREKLYHCKKLLMKLENDNVEMNKLIKLIDESLELLQRRNELLHGRIYSQFEKPALIRSGRSGVPEREISSAELYDLATKIFTIFGPLNYAVEYSIPRALVALKQLKK